MDNEEDYLRDYLRDELYLDIEKEYLMKDFESTTNIYSSNREQSKNRMYSTTTNPAIRTRP